MIRKQKIMILFFALLVSSFLALLFIVPFSSAFTVSPAQTDMYSVKTYSETYTIVNDDDAELRTAISFKNELAAYAQGPSEVLVPANSAASFTVTLDLPELSPGPHDLGVVITQLPTGGQGLSTAIELVPRIRMIQAYPGAFVITQWSVQEWVDPLRSTISFTNYGTAPTDLFIELANQDAQASTNARVEGRSAKSVQLDLPSGSLSKGAHDVNLKVTSAIEPERNNYEETRKIYFGTPLFTIKTARISNILPGEIGRVTLDATTDWNEELLVSVHARIVDGQGRSWDLGTQEVQFSPEGTFSFIWESVGADYGEHTLFLEFTNGIFSGETTAQFNLEENAGLLTETSGLQWALIGVFFLAILALTLYFIRLRSARKD